MPVELIEEPTCDACGEPATHVDVGIAGQALPPEQGWGCDDPFHSMDIDMKPIGEVFE